MPRNRVLNLNESILRTLGARGMSMNKEFEKNAILLRASRFVGTSMADSFTVNRRYRRLICNCDMHQLLVLSVTKGNDLVDMSPVLPSVV